MREKMGPLELSDIAYAKDVAELEALIAAGDIEGLRERRRQTFGYAVAQHIIKSGQFEIWQRLNRFTEEDPSKVATDSGLGSTQNPSVDPTSAEE